MRHSTVDICWFEICAHSMEWGVVMVWCGVMGGCGHLDSNLSRSD